jgi:hypothetical protein
VSRSVIYNPASIPPNAPATRVLFDRWGDLYPDASVDRDRLAQAGDSLSGYYERLKASRAPEWPSLLAAYGVRDDNDFNGTWQTVQDSIVARIVRGAVGGAGGGPLVVLIHGYNNNEEEAWTTYSYVRAVLQQRRYGDGAVLEVFWDGRTDMGKWRRNANAWGRAQHNAYGVGLGLRRILNSVPHETPVRILTHSHGGKLASVALWNVTSAIPNTRAVWRTWYDSLRMDTTRYRTPTHQNIRLAMIAPAMLGNVIGDQYKSDSSATPPGRRMPIDRLIVGQNRRDKVVQKKWILGIPLPAIIGSTTLGGRPSEYNFYAPGFNLPDQEPVAFCVDFSRLPGPNPKEHAWITYMRRPAVGELLALLFSEESPSQGYLCPPPRR